MTLVAEQILESIRRLPESEQRYLAEEILAGLKETPAFQISRAQLEEAEKRLEEHRKDPSTAISEEDALSHLRSLL